MKRPKAALSAGVLLAGFLAAMPHAQQPPSGAAPAPPPPSAPTPAPAPAAGADAQKKTLTLTGCIQSDPASDEVTFVDAQGNKGSRYRLSGTDAKPYVGKRVKIVGGLMPSPNLAAQAGAVDPTAAAMATRGGAAAGTGSDTVEFHVRKVVPIAGKCPP